MFTHQLFIFSSICLYFPSNRWNRPTSLDPTSLFARRISSPSKEFFDSFVLGTLSCHTSGTRTLLAERIFKHERVNEHGPLHVDSPPPAPPKLPANSTVSEDAQRSSRSPGNEHPSSGTNFSRSQLDQFLILIAEADGSQLSGPNEAADLLASVLLLSPASPTNSMAVNTSQQNLQHSLKYCTRW